MAAHWRRRGLAIIDADVLAREVVAPGSEGLEHIVKRFGAQVLNADGSLNRAQMAARVFAHPGDRLELENITHPRIRQALLARVSELEKSGVPLACYDAALLVEVGVADEYRPLVVVVANDAIQLERALTRDQSNPDALRRRIAAQTPMHQKRAKADYVIENDGTLAELANRADQVLASIRRDLGLIRD